MKNSFLLLSLILIFGWQSAHAENVTDDVQIFSRSAGFNNFVSVDQKNNKVSGYIQLEEGNRVHFEKGSNTDIQAEGTYHIYTVKGANDEVISRKLVVSLEDVNNTTIFFQFARLEMDITHVNFSNNNWQNGVAVTYSSWIDGHPYETKPVILRKMNAALPE